ncbi:MAG: DEAD/DEAH box helicase family protein [Epsilonproteobacteria bacterium]|nr:DEAD/DEAH box helicase family protein [Campylobacterota bacterium]
MKFFNTAGPINPDKHYFVPDRFNDTQVRQLIDQEKYFILHAPRQSGKTTGMVQFVKELNQQGKYKALYVNIEAAQAARSDVEQAMFTIMRAIKNAISLYFGQQDVGYLHLEERTKTSDMISGNNLADFLQFWSANSDKPIVLFIDEIDSLVGDTLISVLRQLRAGYASRPDFFPQAVCLVGVRDVRDYRIWSDSAQATVLGGSAFNIKAKSLTLENFSLAQTRYLLCQHTHETGQKFTDDAIEYVQYLTQGQPWLVNALAYQACFEDVTDHTQTITKEIIDRSKEQLIKQRDTHIDQLVDKLREPRVRAIMDALLAGLGGEQDFPTDDLQYVRDLGLISQRGISIANPIYQEIVPRELSYTKQEALLSQPMWYINDDGSLNMAAMLEGFTQFYRENSQVWLERFAYKEAGPHILLLAYLQRVVNGGGTIHREYALGRGRLDILVCWKAQRIVIELKVARNPNTIPDGLAQTAEYMDANNATEGHLVVFDRSDDKSWDDKIFMRTEHQGKWTIHVWGL